MFAAALIFFRETLEAALFVGIVAAATRGLLRRTHWVAGGVAIGVLGALALAGMAEHISAWAGGIGQDLLNVCILSVALSMLLWHCVWVSTHGREMASQARRLGSSVQHGARPPVALLVAVALAVLREGAETVLFIAGYATGAGGSQGMLLGSALGLVAGVATGGLMYAGLSRIPAQRLFATTNVLIALLAAAIASQLGRALAQAGLVERWSAPLWDSSRVLATDSPLGVVLHALVGYDAQPSGLQLASYVAVLAFIWAGARLSSGRDSAPARSTRSG